MNDTSRPGDDASPVRGRWVRRLRRWAARAGIAAGALVLVATAASFGYNAATARRARPPAGLAYVRTGHIQTRYRQWGTSGTPIVLVHGAFETADTWQPTARLLGAGHRVYALDLAGFGYTQHDGHYTVDDQVRQLLDFLTALDIRRPVLVGHSSGAAIAAGATLRAPDRVGALMFLDGDALATGAGARSPVRWLAVPPYRISLLRLALRSDSLVRGVYQRQCGPSCARPGPAGVAALRRPFQVTGAESALWAMLDQGVAGLVPARLARLRAVTLPKMVVFGAGDDVFSPGSAAQTAELIGAPAPQLIPGAKHLTMISDPGVVAGAISALAARTGG